MRTYTGNSSQCSLVTSMERKLKQNKNRIFVGTELTPGSGEFPREGNGYPLQYSCLENLMGRGTWWARVLGLTEGQT